MFFPALSQFPWTSPFLRVHFVSLANKLLKKHSSHRVRIVNPAPGRGAFTSIDAAKSHVSRGHAVFVSSSEIRFLAGAEQIVNHETSRLMERDRAYWRDVAIQRGGAEVEFEWSPRMGANGYMGMEGRPVVRVKL